MKWHLSLTVLPPIAQFLFVAVDSSSVVLELWFDETNADESSADGPYLEVKSADEWTIVSEITLHSAFLADYECVSKIDFEIDEDEFEVDENECEAFSCGDSGWCYLSPYTKANFECRKMMHPPPGRNEICWAIIADSACCWLWWKLPEHLEGAVDSCSATCSSDFAFILRFVCSVFERGFTSGSKMCYGSRARILIRGWSLSADGYRNWM